MSGGTHEAARADTRPTPKVEVAADDVADCILQALASEGGHLEVSRFGHTLHYGRDRETDQGEVEELKRTCLAAGLPVIDTRDVPANLLGWLALSRPLVAVGRPADPRPWETLSFAPLRHVAKLYWDVGAEVSNMPGIGPPR